MIKKLLPSLSLVLLQGCSDEPATKPVTTPPVTKLSSIPNNTPVAAPAPVPISDPDIYGKQEDYLIEQVANAYKDLFEQLGAQVTCAIENDFAVVDIEVEDEESAKDWDSQAKADKTDLMQNLLSMIYDKIKDKDFMVTISYDNKTLSSAYYFKASEQFTVHEDGEEKGDKNND